MASQANDDQLHRLLALAEAADGPVLQPHWAAGSADGSGAPSSRMGLPLGADPVQLNVAEQLVFAHTHSQHGSNWQLLLSRLPRHTPQALARAWQAAACDRGAGGNGLLARYAVALQQGLTPAASFVACVSSLPHHAQPQPSGAQQAVQQRGGCGTSGRDASQQAAAPAGSSGRSGSPAMQQACRGTMPSSSSEGAALAAILQSHLHSRGQAAISPPPQRPVQQPQQHWQGSLAQSRAARPPAPHNAGSPAARKAKHESAVCSALAQLAQHMSDPEKLARVFSHLQGTVGAALRSRQGSNPAAEATAALARSAAATASAASNGTPRRSTLPTMAAGAGSGSAAAATATGGSPSGGAMPRLPPEVHHMPPQLLQQWIQQQQRKVERLHAQLQQEHTLQPPASQQQQQPARALPAAAPSSEPVRPQIVPSQLGGSAHVIDVRSLAATCEGAAALHALKCLKLLPPQLPDGAQLALQVLLPPSFQQSHRTLGQQQHSQQQTQQQQQQVAASAGAQQAGEQQQEGQPVVASPASSMDDDMDEGEEERSLSPLSTSPQAADEVAQPAGVASDVTAAAAETNAPQQPAEADPAGTMRPPSSVVVVHAHADGLDSLDSDDAAAVVFEAAACYSTGDKRPACVAMQHALTDPYGSDGAAAPPAAKRAAVSVQERA